MESEEAKEKNSKAIKRVPKRRKRASTIDDIGPDLLLRIFGCLDPLDLVRTSAVTKSWYSIIQRSSLWRDAYYKQRHSLTNHFKQGFLPEMPPKDWVRQLVSQQHRAALVHGSVQVHCWKGHSIGVNCCRMQMGSILTGVGDQTARIWCSKSFHCLEEYSTPSKAALVDLDFDESKGLLEETFAFGNVMEVVMCFVPVVDLFNMHTVCVMQTQKQLLDVGMEQSAYLTCTAINALVYSGSMVVL